MISHPVHASQGLADGSQLCNQQSFSDIEATNVIVWLWDSAASGM